MKKLALFLIVIFSFTDGFSQVANPAPDLVVCDDDNDGFAIFDLTLNDAIILGGQSPSDYGVTYHETLTDAQAGINPILNPNNYFNITANLQTIYARVEEFATGNFDTTDFDLIVYLIPEDLGPFQMILCDDDIGGSTLNDEISTFDLTTIDSEATVGNPDLAVIWFETMVDEQNDNPIANPTAYQNLQTPQTIIGRVFNATTGCKTIVNLTLTVYPNPTPQIPLPLEVCDDNGDGFEAFDLTLKDAEIIAGEPDVSVLYFETFLDAEDGDVGNALSSPYFNVVPFSQIVYARVTRDSPPAFLPCYTIVELELVVADDCIIIDIEPSDLYIDEGDENGLAVFDLTVNEAQMLGSLDPAIYLFSYHLTYQDSELGNNPITNPETYQNTANPQIIYVRLYDSNGSAFALANFSIETDGVLGIDNQVLKDLVIYPNPTADIIILSTSRLIEESDIVVFDVLGKRILSRKVAPVNGEVNLNIATLEKGVYFIKISSDGNSVTKKLIKN